MARTMLTLGKKSTGVLADLKFVEHFSNVIYLSVCQMANTHKFRVDCVQF